MPMFRNRGRRAFTLNTALLKELAETFWTAKTMAALAEQVLQEMDKAVASMAQEAEPAENESAESNDIALHSTAELPGPGFRHTKLQLHAVDANEMSIFDTAPGLDVFGHFDPAFNLDAVDAALEGNLDFGTSSNWFDWQQTWG